MTRWRRCGGAWVAAVPSLGRLDHVAPSPWGVFGAAGALDSEPFKLPVADFYMTNAICRASVTMAECSAAFGGGGGRRARRANG